MNVMTVIDLNISNIWLLMNLLLSLAANTSI